MPRKPKPKTIDERALTQTLMFEILSAAGAKKITAGGEFTQDQVSSILNVLTDLMVAMLTAVENCDVVIMEAITRVFEDRVRATRTVRGQITCLDKAHGPDAAHTQTTH